MNLIPPFLQRRTSAADPEVLLRELQERDGAVAGIGTEEGWRDAPPPKPGVVVLCLPGLPDDDGRIEWNEHEAQYVRGRNLAGYLEGLGLATEAVGHVIIDGAVIRPTDSFTVELPQSRLGRMWRRLTRRPPPTEQLLAFEAFIPREGAVIHVVPDVLGKNSSLILGIVGAVIGAAIGFAGGSYWGAIKGAAYGWSLGSAIGAIITPRPHIVKDKDGPSSQMFGGITNDDRAGVPVEILLGERLVAGGRISAFRRRAETIFSEARPGHGEDPVYVPAAPQNASDKAHILIRIAGHETEGPVGHSNPNASANYTDNLPDIRINGQHYSNFPGVTVEWRTGAAGQSVIPGFDVLANSYDVSVDVTALGAGTPHTYTTVSSQVDAFEVLLVLAGLSHTTSKGLSSNKTRYKIEYKRNGTGDPYTNIDPTLGYSEIEAATQTAKYITRRVESLVRAKYDIRVTWISADHTNVANDQWHVAISTITEETQEALNYEGDSLVAVMGLASEQFNGPLQSIVVTAMWRGAKPQKWTSGGGFAAASWGVGSATPAGRNRGWLTLWLLRNKRLGLGNDIADADINLSAWKAFADKCDVIETVTPTVGSPFTEPRHQLDAYINQQQAAVDLVQQLLGSARAALIFSGNKVSVGYDDTATAAQRFGMGNIKERSLRLQYRSERNEINTYDVIFEDRAADFDTDTVTVCIKSDGTFCTEAELQAAGETVKRRQLQVIGTTRRTEAVRAGRLALRQSYTIRTLASFGASTDSMFCEAFDVIEVSHDLTQWGYSGHVRAGSAAWVVVVDRNVPFGGSYSVMVRFAAGDAGADYFEERAVASITASGNYWSINLSSPFSRTPQEGDLWFYGPTTTKLKPFRIMEISRDADCQREISAVEFNSSIYDLAHPIEIPTYSILPNFAAPPAPITAAVSFVETKTSSTNGAVVKQVIVQATPPVSNDPKYGFPKGMRVEYGFTAAGPWVALQSVDGFEFRWADAPHGVDLFFRLTPYSTLGRYNYDGAYIITTPVNVSDVWSRPIFPVAPTSVVFAEHATPTKRRAVSSVTDPQIDKKKVFHVVVNFSYLDLLNPSSTHVGFRVVVYKSGGSPSDPHWEGEVTDGSNGTHTIGVPDFEIDDAADYVAAVQAMYVDGAASSFTTSTGLSLDPKVLEPYLQSGDDRQVAPFSEDFTRSAVPAGFTASPNDTLNPFSYGWLTVQPTNAGNTLVQWAVRTWGNAYLDKLTSFGPGFVGFRLQLNSVATLVANAVMLVSIDPNGSGVFTNIQVPIIRDTKWHIYRVDNPTFTFSFLGSNAPVVRIDLSNAFSTPTIWTLDSIALLSDGVSWMDDGWVYRAGKARDQFGRDPFGLGYFLSSSLQLADASGNVTIVDKNGIKYLHADGVVDTPFKSIIETVLRNVTSGQFISWTALSPVLRSTPFANKIRSFVQRARHDIDSYTFAPLRYYVGVGEICDFGFRVHVYRIEGGTAQLLFDQAPAGDGWSATTTKHSLMTLHTPPSPVADSRDAWYDPLATTLGTLVYEDIMWIGVDAPLVKKSDGTFWYMDLLFQVYCATGKINVNPPQFPGDAPDLTIASVRMRVFTDGTRQRMPITRGISDSSSSAKWYKIVWFGFEPEVVGLTPTRVVLDAFEAHYIISPGSSGGHAISQDVDLTIGEVF